MALAAFDTHTFVKRLTAAGMPLEQAEVLSEEQTRLIDDRLATKDDLSRLETGLRSDMEKLGTGLRHEMHSLRKGLADIEERTDVKLDKLGTGLRHEMRELEVGLRSDMEKLGAELRHEIQGVETGLRHEMDGLCYEISELRKDMDAKHESSRKDMDAKHESSRKDTDAKLGEIKFDLVRWLITLAIAQASLVISVLKFFPTPS